MPTRAEPAPPLVLSCEHGGNRVPGRWQKLFQDSRAVLESHRGWDPGALLLARTLSRRLGAPLLSTTVTRLLVEPNRSLGHPRLFSELTRGLPESERALILERHWWAHRARVQRALENALRRSGKVVHVGVHSFTRVLDGQVRDVDVGLLYDPRRPRERDFCQGWIRDLREALPGCRVRANAPYRGTSDGLTTHLREVLGERYLGIELEVAQDVLLENEAARRRLGVALARTMEQRLASAPARSGQRTGPVPSAVGRRADPALAKRTTPTSGW